MYTPRNPADDLAGRLRPYVPQASGGEERLGLERWRLFVAIPLPDEINRVLAYLPSMLAKRDAVAIRWIAPDGIHLTLQFIGDTDPAQVPAISGALDSAASQSGRFGLKLGSPGAFPSLQRPRIFWIGLEGEVDRLKRLQGRVEGGLSRLGIAAEPRPFEPHLTVGRLQRDPRPQDVRQAGAAFGRMRFPDRDYEFAVEDVVLFRSYLHQSGARYEALHSAPLG